MHKSVLAALLGLLAIVGLSAPAFSNNGNVTVASWYQCCHTTANGEAFNPDGLTAAHRTLPFGTRVEVTNLANNLTVTVRINDRGPFIGGRGLDLSRGAARAIGCISSGTCRVSMDIL
jgi:rare lipoprotein A